MTVPELLDLLAAWVRGPRWEDWCTRRVPDGLLLQRALTRFRLEVRADDWMDLLVLPAWDDVLSLCRRAEGWFLHGADQIRPVTAESWRQALERAEALVAV